MGNYSPLLGGTCFVAVLVVAVVVLATGPRTLTDLAEAEAEAEGYSSCARGSLSAQARPIPRRLSQRLAEMAVRI